MTQLAEAFERFANLLTERLELRVFTTEDSIRYTFYAALVASGLKHSDFVLEFPHPAIPEAEIDTIVREGDGRRPVAIEFKYDRANPGGTNQNRTQRAAAALVDIYRLVKVPPSLATVKYFVYVTDGEMAGYFRNPANGLCEFFGVSGTTRIALGPSVFKGFSKTFVSRIAPFACDCQVSGAFATDLPLDHCVRAFEVHSV